MRIPKGGTPLSPSKVRAEGEHNLIEAQWTHFLPLVLWTRGREVGVRTNIY